MDFLVLIHIFVRSIYLKKKVPSNYKQILKTTNNIPQLIGNKIIFSFFKDGLTTKLNAAGNINGYIIFSPEWAARYVLFDDDDTKNAFLITIGHELTHKDNECSLKGTRKDKQFISQVNEVHADFGAAQKMVNGNRQKILKSIEYKKALTKNDTGDPEHPSWAKRKYYIENYNFNSELIERIAIDLNYTNMELINKVSNFYEDIILN